MNLELAAKIAKTILYEGYILYPYGPTALKNRQRWTFGGIYPQASSPDYTPYWMQTECLLEGSSDTVLEVRVRFLHLLSRTVGEEIPNFSKSALPCNPCKEQFRKVESLQVGAKTYYSWQEAVEREVNTARIKLTDLCAETMKVPISFSAFESFESLPGGAVIREQYPIDGLIEISAKCLDNFIYSINIKISNLSKLITPINETVLSRDDILLQSLVSTHTLLGAMKGEFLSLLDPPEKARKWASEQKNQGTWPVLIGEAGRDADRSSIILSSPIILYDFPQIAPESPSDLFDSTEIDEILSLRIMTLSEKEKNEMRQFDPHVAAILERVESLNSMDLQKMHGTFRKSRSSGWMGEGE
jgi:hypothetical protein